MENTSAIHSNTIKEKSLFRIFTISWTLSLTHHNFITGMFLLKLTLSCTGKNTYPMALSEQCHTSFFILQERFSKQILSVELTSCINTPNICQNKHMQHYQPQGLGHHGSLIAMGIFNALETIKNAFSENAKWIHT